jgi:hypothetical protein
MTTTDLQHAHPLGSAATPLPVAAGGPFRRIVVGSLTSGALAAVVLTLGVFPGAVEHVTSGIALLAFAAGWALLAGLTSRWTERPQRWAYVPAAVLATGGLALVTLAPGDDALTAASWGWPPALLVVVLWSAAAGARVDPRPDPLAGLPGPRRARSSLDGRAGQQRRAGA